MTDVKIPSRKLSFAKGKPNQKTNVHQATRPPKLKRPIGATGTAPQGNKIKKKGKSSEAVEDEKTVDHHAGTASKGKKIVKKGKSSEIIEEENNVDDHPSHKV
jgi:hypothetical protein